MFKFFGYRYLYCIWKFVATRGLIRIVFKYSVLDARDAPFTPMQLPSSAVVSPVRFQQGVVRQLNFSSDLNPHSKNGSSNKSKLKGIVPVVNNGFQHILIPGTGTILGSKQGTGRHLLAKLHIPVPYLQSPKLYHRYRYRVP